MDKRNCNRRTKLLVWLVLLAAALALLAIHPLAVGASAPPEQDDWEVAEKTVLGRDYRYEDYYLPFSQFAPSADGDTYPTYVYAPSSNVKWHGIQYDSWHGTLRVTAGCESTPGWNVEVYCYDKDKWFQSDRCHSLYGSVMQKVQWILCNYFPQTGEPSGLSDDQKGAAVQEAIWHFRNGTSVSGAAAAIVNAANAAGAELYTPWTLELTPASDTNPVDTQHTVTAELLDSNNDGVEGWTVSFSVTGANSASGSDTTDSNGIATFTYTGSNAGDDTITAQVSYVELGAYRWRYSSDKQDLVKANPHPRTLTDTATKKWLPAECEVHATLSGEGCLEPGQQATLQVSTSGTICPGTLHYEWYRDGTKIPGAPDASSYTTGVGGVYKVKAVSYTHLRAHET